MTLIDCDSNPVSPMVASRRVIKKHIYQETEDVKCLNSFTTLVMVGLDEI